MKIVVEQNGFHDFHHEIFHVLKLFYEQVEVIEPAESEDAALLRLELVDQDGDADKVQVSGVFQCEDGKFELVTERSGTLRTGSDSRSIVRRTVLSNVLGMLRQATGLEQPWGILTGVRPTKLMHKLMRQHGRERAEMILREEYLVKEEKVQLLADVSERQLQVIPDLFALNREVSIYIGIPFCPTKCAYCTFPAYDIRGNNGSVEQFLKGLDYEIRATGKWLREQGIGITTIYWGGGTPTSITAEQMDALFQAIHESFPRLEQVRELTVEAGRPDTITPDKIDVMKKWHVDRISINPQSFKQETLDLIGRHHTVTETLDKFQLARDMGMNNINMDLIIGLPNEDTGTFANTLAETEKLMPESLTVHTLSFKRASRMTKNREQYDVAERSEIEQMVQMTNEWTLHHGYVPYYLYRQKNILGNLENVGYALQGYESIYNIVMMEERQTIIGLGCGAVSKIVFEHEAGAGPDEEGRRIERMPNPKEPSAYNSSYQQYVDKKLNLLNEAYGTI